MTTAKILKPLIGNGNTLMVTCFDCCLELDVFGDQRVFRHTSLANILYDHDETHREIVYHYVNHSGCKNIVIVGNTSCSAIDRIVGSTGPGFYVAPYQKEISRIRADNHLCFTNERTGRLILSEQIVLKQCQVIASYPGIREAMLRGEVSVSGVLINADKTKVVFKNGVRYNDVVSSN